MITRDSLDLYLPIFAGQGTSAATAPKTRETALSDASSSSGTLLLTACFEAFHHELSYLPAGDFSVLDIDRADFSLPKDLLSTPEQRYEHNAVVSGSTIFLIQILRYLVFAETTRIPINSVTPFSDILKGNIEHELGIIGFSSGILPACVVATSFSTLSYVTNAVEAYRLAIWVGIRSHLYRVQTLNAASLDSNTDLPWSLVLIGITKVDAENALATYNKGNDEAKLYLTAIMNDTCVTISGRPDILSDFSTFLATNVKVIIHKTSLGTLYHSPIHANSTRDQVLRDVVARRIRFPEFSDIQVPIRSTFTGDAITKNETSGSLLELVVDLLLVHPVNWNIMVDHLIKSLPQDTHIRLLNVGPGLGLTRSMERVLPRGQVSIFDLSTASIQSHPQPPPKQEPIAIIGMAVNMPGAPNVSKLWEVLEHGINTVSEIPGCRFRISDYQESKNSQRYMKARTGNFIEGADEFDNKFFKISPREAKNMDPQQRILLHTAYEALEDSGYVPNSTPTNRPESFGCYIGVSTHDYLQNLRDNIDVYYSPGTLKAFLSGRISYAMQLSGPSIVVDTACSSSNVALYHGARALMNRDCNAALVGGINIITSPDMFLGLDRGHFLSPTGQCKSFDAAADGYSRGEGCGVFVLKRLSDAVADNDRILGVIRGIEVNQSGRAHSITHPHAPTQAALFRRVLKNSNIDPNRVNVIEAHGTGTQAGDPHELESIRSVFSAQRTVNNPLHITSIKANIGHLEAASGSAGLAKLLLMFQHQTIPRQISLYTLNPRITPLENDHTIIDSVSVPWHPAPNGSTRIAMLNNFGAAGSNSALLVEEHQKPVVTSNFGETHFLFGFSAKTDSALESLRSRYLDFLENPGASSLADIAYTMTARRLIYDHRLAVSADSKEDLIIKLRRALPSQATPKDARTVFVFSGQGGQYLGMGRSLYQKSQLFKFHVDECHAILRKEGSPGVLPILTADSPTSGLADLEEFEAYQASIFTLQYAMARLWISWGVSPAAVVGHSLGEYAALVIAGVMSVEDALHIVAHRVRLMVQRCAANETGMIAINLGPIALHDVLSASTEFSELSIACYNSPIDCVLSGPLMKLKALKAHLDAEIRCKNVLLAVPFGYHSQAMSPLLEDLNIIAQRVTLNPPNIPIVSNVLGELVHPGDHSIFVADYFARHCAEPVQFDKGIRSLVASCSSTPIDLWIEIGPHTTTLPMIKANHSLRRGNILIGSLRKQRDGWETLTGSLAQLYSSGINVRWRDTFAHLQGVKCISLPSYPFSPSKFWVEYKEHLQTSAAQASSTSSSSTGYSMLGSWVQWPSSENENTAIFETPIEKVARWINGHSVGGMPLCPASVYIEQALSAIHLTCAHLDQALQGSHAALRKLVFAKPLVHDSSIERILITTVQIQTGSGTFRISSRMSSAKDEDTHAYGECRLQPTTSTLTKFIRTLPTVSRYIAAVSRASSGIHPEVFSARTAYEVIFPRVVVYSKEYRSIRSLTVDASNMEGCADVRLPEDYNGGKFVVHPVFSDTLLHVAGFVANLQGGADDAFICSEVDSIKILPDLVDNDASYTIYCSNSWVPEDEMVLSDAYAVLSGESKKIVAHIKGIQFRRVRLDRLKRALSLTSKQNTVHPYKNAASLSFEVEQNPAIKTSSIATIVINLVSETCGLAAPELDLHMDLASLGVDSLMSIELFGRLGLAFTAAHLSAHTLSFCTTVADIIREVSTKMCVKSTGSDSPITVLSGASTPRTLFPEDAPSDSTQNEELDVKDILASVLGLATYDIDDDVDFDSLGLDSLTSIEMFHAIENEFDLELPSNLLTTYRTSRTLQTYLTSRLSKIAKVRHPEIVHEKLNLTIPTNTDTKFKTLRLEVNPISVQSSNSNRLPLFFIHDGSGLVNYYERLPPLDRPIWAIHNPNFSTSQPWNSISEMARTYAKLIANLIIGPIIVGGWSFGGVAAYEVARQLELLGRTTQGILLIDAPNPVGHVPLSDSIINTVLHLQRRSIISSEIGRLVKAQFSMNSRLLGNYKPEPFMHDSPHLIMLRSKEGFKPPHVQVPAWLSDRTRPEAAISGWQTLSRGHVDILDIPGHHFEPFHRNNIETTSLRISQACARLEQL